MPNVERWCAVMDRHDAQRVILSNLIYDVERNRADKPAAAGLLERAVAAWEATGPDADTTDAVASLDDALVGTPEAALCLGPKVTLNEDVSRVTDHIGVWLNHLNQSAFGPPRRGIPDASFWKRMAEDDLTEEQIKKGSEIRGRVRPLGWITTRETIATLRAHTKTDIDFATGVRNSLGLDYFDRGYVLLELRYPTDALTSTRVAAPTVVEGGTKSVYRSFNGDGGWGRAVHLESDPKENGGPEAVHPPIAFTHLFKIAYIGEVSSCPPAIPASDLLQRCPRHWKPPDDVGRLQLLIDTKE